MNIIIRADSGAIMGSGHVMRCLVLADNLKQQVTFACRNLSGNIIHVIESRGYAVKILHESAAAANKEFIDFIKAEQPWLLIIDNYDICIELEQLARPYAQKILVIDDLANRKHDCDFLLNQNPCPATHVGYNNLIPASAINFFGLEYALLGDEFARHKKIISTSSAIKNILIFFGGGDHKNLTKTVLKYILNAEQFKSGKYKKINFNVVVGSANPNRETIRALCEGQENLNFHCQINNMAQLMGQADLFIGAGGITSWERMCVGLPAIIISIAGNQEESCHELAKLDLIKYLGSAEKFTQEKLMQALNWIEQNPEWLYNAAAKGQQMVDGCGARRVASIIKSSYITFKQASEDDCKNIFFLYVGLKMGYQCLNKDKFTLSKYSLVTLRREDMPLIKEWRNSQIDVLRQDRILTDEDQINYYNNYVEPGFSQKEPTQILFSFLYENKAIGYGGLTNISRSSYRAKISFLLDPEFVKNDLLYEEYFSAFLTIIKNIAFDCMKLNRIFTETFDIRPLHISILEKNGFIFEGRMKQHVHINGHFVDSLLHGYLKEELC